MAKASGYLLTEKIPVDQKFRGQAELIKNEMSTTEPKTVAAIVAQIEGRGLVTRQDPARVVSFYMSTWKKKGWVRAVDVETTEAAASVDTADEPQNDHESGIEMTPDERNEAKMQADVEATHEEPRDPGISSGMKLSEASLVSLRFTSRAMTPQDLADFLGNHGYKTEAKRVQSALQNLVSKGSVAKTEGNAYQAVN
jgi:hypothetical protein